jgi:hypothetical protein
VEIFYSYAHADAPLSEEMRKHLTALKRSGLIRDWYDRKIDEGSEWALKIQEAMERAGRTTNSPLDVGLRIDSRCAAVCDLPASRNCRLQTLAACFRPGGNRRRPNGQSLHRIPRRLAKHRDISLTGQSPAAAN